MHRTIDDRECAETGERFGVPALARTEQPGDLADLLGEQADRINGSDRRDRHDPGGQQLVEVFVEDGLQKVPVERDPGLRLQVKVTLTDVDQVVLRRISQPVDGLQGERLLIGEELDAARGQRPTHAGVKPNGVLLAPLPDPAVAVKDLERVVHEHEHGVGAALVPRPVEVFDTQGKRVDGLVLQ